MAGTSTSARCVKVGALVVCSTLALVSIAAHVHRASHIPNSSVESGGLFLFSIHPDALGNAAPRLSAYEVIAFVPPSSFLVHMSPSSASAFNDSAVVSVRAYEAVEKTAAATALRRALAGIDAHASIDERSHLPIRVSTACASSRNVSACIGACTLMHDILGAYPTIRVLTHHGVPCGGTLPPLPQSSIPPLPYLVTLHPVTPTMIVVSVECTSQERNLSAPCALPLPMLTFIAAHPLVTWLEPIHPTTTHNAHARGALLSLDGDDWDGLHAEYGDCATPAACIQSRTWNFLSQPVDSPTCSAACAVPQCNFGYQPCSLQIAASPLAAAGLDGSGQLVAVADSGLDYTHPMFFDPLFPITPSKTGPFPLSSHRKIAGYHSFMDAVDGVGGHGTHVCGSIAGSPISSGASATDVAALLPFSGLAPAARLYFSDIGCDTPSGCVCPKGVPCYCDWYRSGICPANNRSMYVPSDPTLMLQWAYFSAGARIASYSLGTSQPLYTDATAAMDSFIYSRAPDLLVLFAASNDGGSGYATLGNQATMKNALVVGAAQSGLDQHAYVLQQWDGGGSCNALTSAVSSLLRISSVCSQSCSFLFSLVANNSAGCSPPPEVTASYSSSWINGPLADVALCCGCTLSAMAYSRSSSTLACNANSLTLSYR